jgi:pantoate--beta-alanine ligase
VVRVERTIAGIRAALAQPRRAGARIGLVPTMGAFHDGHLSLMRRAREQCGVVVVSLFVNAPQFSEEGDLAAYPRDEQRDLALAAEVGADLMFIPSEREMYPEGFASVVSVGGLTQRLEGAARGPAHFQAVATVVTKLLNIVGPDVAYFGAKDVQQALVIDRLVRDLDIPVAIEVCPTVRDPDGLALSSRNARLSAREREQAGALNRALRIAAEKVAAGERDAQVVTAAARAELDRAGVSTEYLELVRADTLAPVARIDGSALAVVAARVGDTRLIDNQTLSTIWMAGSPQNGSE